MSQERKHSRSTDRALVRTRGNGARHSLWVRAGLALSLLLVLALVFAQAVEYVGVAPRLVGEHVLQRVSGHGDWVQALGRQVNRVLQAIDRGDTLPYPELPQWVGARAALSAASAKPGKIVALPDELRAAIEAAKPGDTITIAPGTYRYSRSGLATSRAGTATAPITVRAEMFGTVTIEIEAVEGFLVTAPYWRFENLVVQGVCTRHEACEHAFHVVGGAHHTELRNNLLRNFNAHVKINGHEGRFPDRGRILDNTLINDTPRRTDTPVTPIDLVAASEWLIEGNLIADFAKDGGDFTSYGAFAKGAGSGNQFVRNVVICERRLRGVPGRRIGLSFGGGGSRPEGCRDRKCVIEHEDGLMAHNLIASCSDEGIYIKRSPRTRLVHNTVLDTAGIYVRYPESSAVATANLVDGAIRAREGSLLDMADNMTSPLWSLYLGRHTQRDLFADVHALDLRFRSAPAMVPSEQGGRDLCGQPSAQLAAVGAFQDFAVCLRDGVR